MMDNNGIQLVRGILGRSMMRAHCTDIDIEGTYPNVEDVMNISKETTYRELHQIQGLSEQDRREFGINLTGGVSNAVEIATKVFGLPGMFQLLEIYKNNRPVQPMQLAA